VKFVLIALVIGALPLGVMGRSYAAVG